MKPDPSRLTLSAYTHRAEIQTRFSDVDPQWHLNNVRVLEFYQEARTSFNMALWGESTLDAATQRLFVARQAIDYLGEAKWPGSLSVGVGIVRIGNSSYTMGMAMFQHDKCVGVCDAVLVYADEKGPARIPEHIRGRMAAQQL